MQPIPAIFVMARVIAYMLVIIVLRMVDGRTVLIPYQRDQPRACENITIAMCALLGYGSTQMPHKIGPLKVVANQFEAESELVQFQPLINFSCSPQLALFLCAAYLPMCHPGSTQLILPCQPLCESVQRSCEGILLRHGYPWPDHLNCSHFPPNNNDERMCIMGDEPSTPRLQTSSSPRTKQDARTTTTDIPNAHPGCIVNRQRWHNYVYDDKTKTCSLLCGKEGIFSKNERLRTDYFILGWAVVCLCCSGLSLVLRLISARTSHSVSTLVVFPQAWLLLYSLVLVAKFSLGHQRVTCSVNVKGYNVHVSDGLENVLCAATFITYYLCFISQVLWWTVLTLVVFLRACVNWTERPLVSLHGYYHAVVWPCAVFLVLASLISRKVDVDELTGLCFVGGRLNNLTAFSGFVLGPFVTFLVIGTIFTLTTYASVAYRLFCAPTNQAPNKMADGMLADLVGVGMVGMMNATILATLIYDYVVKVAWLTSPDDLGHLDSHYVPVVIARHVLLATLGVVYAAWSIVHVWPLPGLRCSPERTRDSDATRTTLLSPIRECPT